MGYHMDIVRHTPAEAPLFNMAKAKAALSWATGATVGTGALVGGIQAQRNQEPLAPLTPTQIEQPSSFLRADITCTGSRKETTPTSLDTGVMISLKVTTKGIPSNGTILVISNPKTGEEIIGGYFTPEEPIPATVKFLNVVQDKQPKNQDKPDKDKPWLHLRPDDPITVTLQESLPNGMYIKKQDLKAQSDASGPGLAAIDIPREGNVIAQIDINPLCP